MELILISTFFLAIAASHLLLVIYEGHWYLPHPKRTSFVIYKTNYNLWGKAVDPTHLTGMNARVAPALLLICFLIYYYAIVYSQQINNDWIYLITLSAIAGIVIGILYNRQSKSKWLRHQEANPIRIKRDY